MLILGVEYASPELGGLAFDKITSLLTVKIVFVSDLDEFLVTGAPSAFVCSESQIWIPLLTVLTDDLAIVELVLDKEILDVLVAGVDVYFGESVVQSRVLDPLFIPLFKPLS